MHVEPITVFKTQSAIPVSAGIAPFNASLAVNFLPGYLAVVATSQVWILFYNFLEGMEVVSSATKACSGPDCSSYFFTGSLNMVAPYSTQPTSLLDASAYVVKGAPGLQGDYWNVSANEAPVTSDDCQTWGYSFAAIMICIKSSSLGNNALIAGTIPSITELKVVQGLNICPMELIQTDQCLSNKTWTESVPISTSLLFSSSTADAAYFKRNTTLFNLENFSKPVPIAVDPSDLFFALNRFFYDPPLAPNQTSSTLNAIEYLNSFILGVLANTSSGALGAKEWLREMLTMLLILFQANNDPTTGSITPRTSPKPNLPSNMYVTMETSRIDRRIIIPLWIALVYSIIVGVLCVLCSVCLIWGLNKPLPNISSFPIVDFVARVSSGGVQETSLVNVFSTVAATTEVRKHLEDVQLHLGEISVEGSDGESDNEKAKLIGFSTRRFSTESLRLNRRSKYQW